MASLRPYDLRVEARREPLGLDVRRPRFSWKLSGIGRDLAQQGYQIQVAADDRFEPHSLLYDSGRVASGETLHIRYEGPPLQSRGRYAWRVRVFDREGAASPFSEPAHWEMGLLEEQDWRARWIAAPVGPTAGEYGADWLSERTRVLSPPAYIRRAFTVDGPVRRARLYITALGVYEPYVNGVRVGPRVLAPGWTDYRRRVYYQSFDVTALLGAGENAIGVILGDGWYAGYVGYKVERHLYGDRPCLRAQLEVETAAGDRLCLATDETWRAAVGPIRYSDILMGEWYDARAELPGWATPAYDDRDWPTTHVVTPAVGALEADPTDGIAVTETRPVRGWREVSPGCWIGDTGQNLAGVVRLVADGPAGATVRLRYGEMLNADGSLHTENLRAAEATDYVTLAGSGPVTFTPHFTYHGFRYVEVTGLPDPPGPDTATALVVHDALQPTAEFSTSSALLNRLFSNIVASQRSNFVSIPTDCPQRDERLGWLGDAQVFVRTATFNMDVQPFFTKWLRDLRDAVGPTGAFPNVAPRLVNVDDGAPGWGDAGVIVPWTLYRVYGDPRILEEHYPAMQGWMRYVEAANPDGLWRENRSWDWGDHLAPDPNTPRDLVATCFYGYDAAIMRRVAEVVGRQDDARHYGELAERVRQAFQVAFVTAPDRLLGDTQGAYALALGMGLLPESLHAGMARRLAEKVEADGHIATGFLSTPFLLPALSDAGYGELAYRLALATELPSWGYMVAHGATTIWERWDGWTAERGFHPDPMNSFNHYGLGSVGEWLMRYVVGIDLDERIVGYRRIRVAPLVTDQLAWASGRYHSPRGTIGVDWRWDGQALLVDVELPANTEGRVILPLTVGRRRLARVTEGGRPPDPAWQAREAVTPRGPVMALSLGSGHYAFSVEP